MRLILAAALVAASAGAAQAQWYYDNPYNLPPSIGPSYYERDAQLRAETQETVDRMMQQRQFQQQYWQQEQQLELLREQNAILQGRR